MTAIDEPAIGDDGEPDQSAPASSIKRLAQQAETGMESTHEETAITQADIDELVDKLDTKKIAKNQQSQQENIASRQQRGC